jgi:cell wall-associated NlpC family hydrolase
MAGVSHNFGQFNPEEWDISPLVNESEQKAGDVILIGGDEDYTVQDAHVRKTITHLAVYLGSGFYLSKFGVSGKLIVANIEEMKKGFGGTAVYRLRVPHGNDELQS